ncbi:ABC transporter permease subunit [Pseudoclavibacter sp. 13-3]|uniref:ABC transporter permease subunit n=1 Tax=Pseudoclavibacter sp. 13-3 TaxID=2901228 RepID=UPI001E63B99C|nr:ABC transporter permease subunit [Pseudoclavibacter sp. 13-3]MCD7102375.1 ABC transporter permease [Pseudoclavibacter sp. 13-3]
MTAQPPTSAQPPTPAPATRRAAAAALRNDGLGQVRLRFGGVLRSEWIKLWSVRSTWWTLAILVAVGFGLALLVGFAIASLAQQTEAAGAGAGEVLMQGDADLQTVQMLQFAASGIGAAALVASVFGVLNITAEYSGGSITTSMLAVPRRWPVLLAKAVVIGGVLAVLGFVTMALSAIAVSLLLAGQLPGQHPFSSQMLLVSGGAAAYLGALGIISVHIGSIVRSTAAGIAIVVGLLMIVPTVLSIVSGFDISWALTVNDWLPGAAGSALTTLPMDAPEGLDTSGARDQMVAWQGGVSLAAWALVTGALSWVLTLRRDV